MVGIFLPQEILHIIQAVLQIAVGFLIVVHGAADIPHAEEDVLVQNVHVCLLAQGRLVQDQLVALNDVNIRKHFRKVDKYSLFIAADVIVGILIHDKQQVLSPGKHRHQLLHIDGVGLHIGIFVIR